MDRPKKSTRTSEAAENEPEPGYGNKGRSAKRIDEGLMPRHHLVALTSHDREMHILIIHHNSRTRSLFIKGPQKTPPVRRTVGSYDRNFTH